MLTADLLERQRAIESESVELGRERYRKERPMPWRDESAGADEEANLPPGRHLLRQIVRPTADAIRAALKASSQGQAGRSFKAVSMLTLMEPEAVAYLTARCAINAAAKRMGMAPLSGHVAEALRDHLNYDAIRKNEPAFYRSLMNANKKAGNYGRTWRTKIRRAMKAVERLLVSWTPNDKLQIGSKCLELLVSAVPDLFEIVREPNPITFRDELVFRPTAKLTDWLERMHARCELLSPLYLPMVVPPKPWTSPYSGGYLTGEARLIKGAPREYLDGLCAANMQPVYDALNAIQSVRWRINPRVLDVMRTVWDSGASLGGLPSRELRPLPGKPHDIDTNEKARKDWCKKAAIVHQENARSKSKRIAMSQLLWTAEKFADEEAIYYPHELDFRGRVYPKPMGGPNPQGDDLQKSLLMFAEGKPLGPEGPMWLAIHIANLFGVDKVGFKERVQWVFDHEELILDSARNPLDGERFWTTADSPYCALAACFEWEGYVAEGEAFVSHLPIALDGSNSGLQHFSAMLRDPEGAALVNLVPSDKPADIYMAVAERVQAIADASDDPGAQPWKGGKVVRRIAKRPVMTYCYAATRFGMQEMIESELYKLDAERREEGKPPHLEGASNYEAAHWLSYVMYDAIGETVRAASGAMEWLKQAATVAAKAGLPVCWTSPIGLPVLHDYRKMTAERVKVFVNGQMVKYVLEKPTLDIDARSQASAVAPNFVHSCDAAHLMRVALACRERGITSLAVIHDSFGTHACDTSLLSRLLRETLVEQYSRDVLGDFAKELRKQLPEEVAAELPPTPQMGTLDLNEVRASAYAFA